jgi:hypothetical protein
LPLHRKIVSRIDRNRFLQQTGDSVNCIGGTLLEQTSCFEAAQIGLRIGARRGATGEMLIAAQPKL